MYLNLPTDCSVPAPNNNIEQFLQDDKHYRANIDLGQYLSLPRATFDDISEPEDYLRFTRHLQPVMFIDLGDIQRFINQRAQYGLDQEHVARVVDICCDSYDDDENVGSIIWEYFSEDLTEVLTAKLGGDEELVEDAFNTAMGHLSDISHILFCYLVNAHAPIIESSCIYQFENYKNGLVALRLRTLEELHGLFAQ